MDDGRRITVAAGSDELAAGIDDINQRLRALLARRPDFRARRLPRTWPAPRVPCLGRDTALTALATALSTGGHVCVCGPSGIGKTTFLYRAATLGVLAADTVPDRAGMVWPSSGFRHAEDLLRDLFAACYHVGPDTPVPDTTVRRFLRPIAALVVLDNMMLPADELRSVVEAMPDSTFVIAADRPDPPGLAQPLPLAGLTLDDGIRLVTGRLDGTPTDDDIARASGVWEEYDGNPGRLARLADYLATAGEPGADLRAPTPRELPLVVPRVVAGLHPSARDTLAVLAALPDVAWGAPVLGAVSTAPEDLGARRLVDRWLAVCLDGHRSQFGRRHRLQRRYLLAPDVSENLPADLAVDAGTIAGRLTAWLRAHGRPVRAAAAADVIEGTLVATMARQQHRKALVLAKVASRLLVNSPDWSALRRILLIGRQAAKAVGSASDERYFTYGLAAYAVANQKTDEAARLLDLIIGAGHDTDDGYAAERAAELRAHIEGGAVEHAEVLPVVAVARTVKFWIARVPGVPPVLRFASENPVLARIAIGAVAATIAAVTALLALPNADRTTAPTPEAAARPVFDTTTAAVPSSSSASSPAPEAPATTSSSGPPAPTTIVRQAQNEPPPTTTIDRTTGTSPPPSYRYSVAPRLSIKWRLDFVRTDFGGALQGQVDPYDITLTLDTSAQCPYPAPCYSGRFADPTTAVLSAPTFYATDYVSGDQIVFEGTSSDYADRGPQIYTGSAPDDTRVPVEFTGTFVQHIDTGNVDWHATFTFYPLP